MKRAIMLVVLAAAGCKTKSASEYRTDEIQAWMHAESSGDGRTTVEVKFQDPSDPLTTLQLTADDSLTATMADQTQELSESSLLGDVSYSADFHSDSGAVHVTLTRRIDGGAPDSYVTLPAPFTYDPLGSDRYSRAAAMQLSLVGGSSSDLLWVEVSSLCLETYQAELDPVATSVFIPAGALHLACTQYSCEPDTCQATLTLTRRRSGTLDPAYHSGDFVAEQTGSWNFITMP